MDRNLWMGDLKEFHAGKYSYASVVTNTTNQSFSQVETGKNMIFVGLYTGHGGDASLASSFVNERLFDCVIDIAASRHFFSEVTLKECIEKMESDFMNTVREKMRANPEYMTSGCCCLTGVIFTDKLYLANLGDNRVVIGSRHRGYLRADLVSEVHNINNQETRANFLKEHPQEEGLITWENNLGVYRIKGKIEVTKSIGDAYLKNAEFEIPRNRSATSVYRITGRFEKPYVGSVPFAKPILLLPTDDFIIFATSTLWDQLSMTEAVEIVSKTRNQREAARNLIDQAVKIAGLKRAVQYRDLIRLTREARHAVHGDITVIVLFLNHGLLGRSLQEPQVLSDKPFTYARERSRFHEISDLM